MEEENKLNRLPSVYLYYWVIPIFVIFLLVNYFADILKIETFDVGFMVSVVSFLFGFFITISFSMILSRVTALKDSLAQETGRLVSLYLLSKNLGIKFHERISELIDSYTINTLRDYETYEVGRNDLVAVYESTNLIEIKTDMQKQLSASFFYILGEWGPCREKLEYLTKDRLMKAMKASNYLLASILITLLFLNRGDLLSNSLFVVLSTTVIFILLIIEDYEDLRIKDYLNNISNSEQLFDLIGKERYYPNNILGRVKLVHGKRYRIGFYDSKEKKERIALIVYNRSFNKKISEYLRKSYSSSSI